MASPSIDARPARPGLMPQRRPNGLVRGLWIGILGLPIWWVGALSEFPRTQGVFWWDPVGNSIGSDRLDVVFPLFLGPVLGCLFSMTLSAFLERRMLMGDRGRSATSVFYACAGVYLTALFLLFALARGVVAGPGDSPVATVLMLCGLLYVGPGAIVAWATLAGAVHAVRRPARGPDRPTSVVPGGVA